MRLCRFDDDRLGLFDEDGIRDVTPALSILGGFRYPLPRHDILIANLQRVRAAIATLHDDGTRHAVGDVILRSPVANPGKLIAAPVNYQAHLEEAIADQATFSRAHARRIEETGLFLKATSSLIGAGEPIRIAHPERRTDHEIELAVVIGKAGRSIRSADALDHVAGYAIGLDITIRGPEERSLRKSLDSYSVLGPWLVTADELDDPVGLDLHLSVDGNVRQSANTRDLILDIPALIAFASNYYTLYPGDVLFSGTPEGVGPIYPGERIDANIDRIGAMSIAVTGA